MAFDPSKVKDEVLLAKVELGKSKKNMNINPIKKADMI